MKNITKNVDVLVGLQFGDEGKGKVINAIAHNYDVIVRHQGGANSGHTVYDKDGEKVVFNVIPSGMIAGVIGVITQGIVINPVAFQIELNRVASNKYMSDIRGRLIISTDVNLTLPTHLLIDAATEIARTKQGVKQIGSTKRGNTPTYEDKVGRRGLRVSDILKGGYEGKYLELRNRHITYLTEVMGMTDEDIFGTELAEGMTFSEYEAEWHKCAQEMKLLIYGNTVSILNDMVRGGKKILLEAAQGAMLDIEYGTYPYVTSTAVTAPSALALCGIPAQHLNKVIGVMKPYITRVGQGFFPTEITEANVLDWPDAEHIVEVGQEFGSVTKRRRKIGWLDLPQLRYACMINGVTDIAMCKTDVVSGLKSINYCYSYISANTREDFLYMGHQKVDANMKRIPSVGDVPEMTDRNSAPIDLLALIRIIDDALADVTTNPRITMVSTSATSPMIQIEQDPIDLQG